MAGGKAGRGGGGGGGGVLFSVFELNFGHMAKVGVPHLGRDRKGCSPRRYALLAACAGATAPDARGRAPLEGRAVAV